MLDAVLPYLRPGWAVVVDLGLLFVWVVQLRSRRIEDDSADYYENWRDYDWG